MGWLDSVGDAVGDAVGAVADGLDGIGRATVWAGDKLIVEPITGTLDGIGRATVWTGRTVQEGVIQEITDGLTVSSRLGDAAAREWVPGYSQVSDGVSTVTRNFPGGWKGIGLVALVLLLIFLCRTAVPASKNVARGLASTYMPRAATLTKGQPLSRTRESRGDSGDSPSVGRCGRSNRDFVVASTTRRLEICTDSENSALATARRRWKGWRVRPIGVVSCGNNPDKLHVRIAKVRAA